MSGDDQPKVENPAIGWLRALKSSVESATSGVKDIDTPTGQIGAGEAWKGTRAKVVHSELAGMAADVRSCLHALAGDVQDAIDAVHPKEVDAQTAHVMQNDHAHNSYY